MPSHFNDEHRPETQTISKIREDINFTRREKQVLGFLLQGIPNKEIADALDLKVVTVKLHVRGICRKLGAKNRTQAALLAQQSGMGVHYASS